MAVAASRVWWPRHCPTVRRCRSRRRRRPASPAGRCRSRCTSSGSSRAGCPGCAEHPHRADRRRRAGPAHHLRRRGHTPHDGPNLRRGRRLQPVPHHGDVFADPRVAADRAQPSPRRQRPDRRAGQRLGRLRRGHPARSSALVAEVLKDYGYSTAGVRQVAQHAGGGDDRGRPVRQLADRLGFEYFYGFLAGEASQYEPNLVRNTTVVLPPKTPEEGYHLSEDLADDAIDWLHRHKAFAAGQAVLHVLGQRAVHGPHHVMKEWADKYKGKFDDGWDAYRERVFKRAKDKGWIPAKTANSPRATDDAGVLGQHPRGREAVPAPPDGGGRRVRRTRRPPGRPARRRDRQTRLRRQHAGLLHLGRQRRPPARDRTGRSANCWRRTAFLTRPSNTSRRSTHWAASTCSARPRPTTSTTPAGPGPAARRTRA